MEMNSVKYDEQDLRIQKILAGVEEENIFKALYKWEEYLNTELNFPFEAVICQYQERGVLKEGDRLMVKGIAGSDDLYGILVKASIQRKRYVFPLFDLEVVDKKSVNYLPIDDYCTWFANR
jgi:hypothetical protein